MYINSHIFLERKYKIWHLLGEILKEKLSKFREGEENYNPEPSYNKTNNYVCKTSGRFIIEGAETIMAYLSYQDDNMVNG